MELLLTGCFGRNRVTFSRLGTKDTQRSVGANGTSKCDICVEARGVAPLPIPMLDIVLTSNGTVGSEAAARARDEERRADTNGVRHTPIGIDGRRPDRGSRGI